MGTGPERASDGIGDAGAKNELQRLVGQPSGLGGQGKRAGPKFLFAQGTSNVFRWFRVKTYIRGFPGPIKRFFAAAVGPPLADQVFPVVSKKTFFSPPFALLTFAAGRPNFV